MRNHSQDMVRFASTLKALMYVCDIDDTEKISQFIGSTNPSTFNPIFLSRLKKLNFNDGVFSENLRHCTCSEIQFDDEKQEVILNPTTYVGETGFCYHSPLSADLSTQYIRLVKFCQQSLSITKGKLLE